MKTILIIEDNNEIRENMAEILELSSYRTLTAADGKQGFEIALEKKPDLIICDIMMPEMDGYDVLQNIKQEPGLQNIPFLFLTAKSERVEIQKGMALGANDYVVKPFDGTDLLNTIGNHLK